MTGVGRLVYNGFVDQMRRLKSGQINIREETRVNKYLIKYTIIQSEGAEAVHKQYAFDSEYDLLGAADEAMSKLFDQFEKDTDTELLFRSIELTNAKEVYKNIVSQKGAKA